MVNRNVFGGLKHSGLLGQVKLRELERMDCLPILNGVAHKSRLYRRPASHVEASVTAFLAFSVPPILRMA
jgi:hypothetical protein